MSPPPLLATIVRDGVVESEHRGHVVVAGPDGAVLAALGDAALPTYVRSAVKPAQSAAVVAILVEQGLSFGEEELALSCASHVGTKRHQDGARALLARVGLEPAALRCPPAWPSDLAAARAQDGPAPLAHNCSGKHAAFLCAQAALGDDPAGYLDPTGALQRRVRTTLDALTGAPSTGPGTDGCGAPAWLVPLHGLATLTARLAAGSHGLEAQRDAMRAHPDLVGGEGCDDTALMAADGRVVAKRGAEAVFAAGLVGVEPIGIAVKVADGGARAAGPIAAALLAALGVTVPDDVRRPTVLGGGAPHGALEVSAEVAGLAAGLR